MKKQTLPILVIVISLFTMMSFAADNTTPPVTIHKTTAKKKPRTASSKTASSDRQRSPLKKHE